MSYVPPHLRNRQPDGAPGDSPRRQDGNQGDRGFPGGGIHRQGLTSFLRIIHMLISCRKTLSAIGAPRGGRRRLPQILEAVATLSGPLRSVHLLLAKHDPFNRRSDSQSSFGAPPGGHMRRTDSQSSFGGMRRNESFGGGMRRNESSSSFRRSDSRSSLYNDAPSRPAPPTRWVDWKPSERVLVRAAVRGLDVPPWHAADSPRPIRNPSAGADTAADCGDA